MNALQATWFVIKVWLGVAALIGLAVGIVVFLPTWAVYALVVVSVFAVSVLIAMDQ